ncbi:Methyl-accepting chemotaxis protein [Yersinia aldovae ATCC 35236]|nr:Methyl-accepting chemotaxis protein [Yersinia aldovae ATCC 35236]
MQSTTDTHGNITYANAAFVRASGFDYQDLLSKPHNMFAVVAGEVRNLAQR